MAKYSPYFKFYVSEYNDGDIQLCSMEAQGLFMNLCSTYWSKEGELFLSKAKRFFKAREKIWKELIDENCIKVNDDRITINFLDEQLKERLIISSKNSENGKQGGRGNKATAFEPLSESKANESNIENRIEEKNKRKEEESEIRDFIWFEKQLDDIWLDQLPSDKKKNLARAKQESWSHLFADKARLKRAGPVECMQLLNTWLARMENKPEKQNGTLKILNDKLKSDALIKSRLAAKEAARGNGSDRDQGHASQDS